MARRTWEKHATKLGAKAAGGAQSASHQASAVAEALEAAKKAFSASLRRSESGVKQN
jgi:hypothetical protein